jgi:signal transduction histidine kinase
VTVLNPNENAHPKRGLRARWQGARHKARHALGVRLVGLFVVLALAMSVVFVIGMQAALRYGWQDFASPLIADYIDTLTAQIGTPPDVARAEALTRRLPLRIRIDGPTVNWSSHPADMHEARFAKSRSASASADRPGNPWRPVRVLADGHRITFGLAALARDAAPEDRPRLIGWATLAALLLLIGLAYAVVRRLLRPLADIGAGAMRYGRGDFSQPIRPRHRDELGDLAEQINHMADGLQHRLDAKRGLLLAISHELRSPLTRARLNAELVAEGPERNALLRDLAQMRDLVIDLLESERLAGGHAVLSTEPSNLNALVGEVLASQFGTEALRFDADDSMQLLLLTLDRTRIRLLLRNLFDNALRHTPEAATAPVVTIRRDGDAVCLTVRDHGPGVADSHLDELAQPFYREDSARQRATGGVGLGLYLCRLVAVAHGGTLSFRNTAPGLEVVVRLPISAPALSR